MNQDPAPQPNEVNNTPQSTISERERNELVKRVASMMGGLPILESRSLQRQQDDFDKRNKRNLPQ